MSKRAAAGIAAVLLWFVMAGAASAELPAPNFMPGFPMIAGPQLMIMWTPVPGAAKYKVFINDKEAAETAAFQHFMPAPEAAGSHAIKVVAVAGDGTLGKASEIKTVKVIKLEPPANIVGRMVENTYALRWDTAPGAMIYNVYRSAVPGKDYKIIGSVQDTRHADKEAPRDKKSFYVVTAKDATGAESPYSKENVFDPVAFAKQAKEDEKVSRKVDLKLLPVKEPACISSGMFGRMEIPQPVARDSRGNFYVGDLKGRVIVLDAGMKFVRLFPTPEDGYILPAPAALFFDNDKQVLYAADRQGLKKLSADGKLVAEYPYKQMVEDNKGNKEFRHGRNVLVNGITMEDGVLYASDNQNQQILVLDQGLKIQKALNISKLCGPIAGLTITPEGNFLFVDVLGARVIEVTKELKVLVSFGEYGVAPGMIGRPNFVFKDVSGSYIVADGMATLFHVFDGKGEYRFNFGKDDKKGLPVISPGGAAFDTETRRLYYTQSLESQFCVVEVPKL